MISGIKHKGILIIFTLLLVVLQGNIAKGAETISVKFLIENALSRNYELVTARHKINEAEAILKQAQKGKDWRGDFVIDTDTAKIPGYMEALYSIMDQELGDSYTIYSGTLAISKVLWDTPSGKTQVNMANLLVSEKKEELRSLSYNIIVEILEGVQGVWKSRDGVSLAEEAKLVRRKNLERVKEKHRAGEAVLREVQEAELEFMEAENVWRVAKDMQELAEKNLAMQCALDISLIQRLEPFDYELGYLPEAYNPWPWTLETMKEIAVKERPENKRVALGIELAKMQLEEVSRRSIDLGIQGSYTSPENHARIGVEITPERRLISTLTYFNTTLPKVDEIEIPQKEWDDFVDTFPWLGDPPSWFPDREQLQKIINQEMAQEDEWQVKFQLKFNIFDSGLKKAMRTEKEEALEAALTLYEQAKDGLKLQVEAAFKELQWTHSEAQKDYLAYSFAKQRLEEVKKMVEVGIATSKEEELASLGILRAKTDLLAKAYDYELAKAKLAASMGLEIDWFLGTIQSL